MTEAEFLTALRALPLHPGARDLRDDAATLGDLVLTTDTLVEGVHFLSTDPAGDVAWKLLAVNLSDLAAKGAAPEGVLLNLPLSEDGWDRAFLAGLAVALATFDTRLIGGDTVSLPRGAPRVLTCTAIGRSPRAPARSGARPGDRLWVTGTIGDAGPGLAAARGEIDSPVLRDAYCRPCPRLAEGRALGGVATAMADVSDGLLIDAARMAAASGLAVTLRLEAVPLSAAFRAVRGADRAARLAAAVAGDDYQLLFALPAGVVPPVAATCVGVFAVGAGLLVTDAGESLPLPGRLGWEHDGGGALVD